MSSHPLPVIILCGGRGTRLREETEYRPKPMVEIGGHPVVWHIMRSYAHYGFNRFVLCLGYKGFMIKEYFLNYRAIANDFTIRLGQNPGLTYVDHDDDVDWTVTMADTGLDTMTGARVKRAASKHVDADAFMLTYGDGLADIDIGALLRFHREAGRLVTVTGIRPPSRFGEMHVTGSVVTSFTEKPQVSEGFVNGGFFVCQREFLDYLSDDESCVLEQEPLRRVAADGELAVYTHTGFWQCMDTFREYELLSSMWEEDRAPWRVWR